MQHFLLSAAARSLSLKKVFRMGEDVAYQTFCQMRWPETEGEAVCPRCGCTETYNIATRRKFKCVGCYHQFSVTSGTIFASRKRHCLHQPGRKLLLAPSPHGSGDAPPHRGAVPLRLRR